MRVPAPSTEREAVRIQTELARLVRVDRPLDTAPRLVAGVDVAYESQSAGAGRIAGAVVVLAIDDLSVVDSATAVGTSSFPYRAHRPPVPAVPASGDHPPGGPGKPRRAR
jgi:deoxyinosine 3'endonuclease (endonuclease V)